MVLTMILECFHLVSLLRMRSRLMQENMFRQQYTAQNTSKLEQRATATTNKSPR